MSLPKGNLERERITLHIMINMYCKKSHNSTKQLCSECMELFRYAEERLKQCRFGEDKPTCEKCPIHCYKPEMREKVRNVMRYSGPRMIYSHPIMGFRHLFKQLKKTKNLE